MKVCRCNAALLGLRAKIIWGLTSFNGQTTGEVVTAITTCDGTPIIMQGINNPSAQINQLNQSFPLNRDWGIMKVCLPEFFEITRRANTAENQKNPGNRGKGNGVNVSNGSSQSARKNSASVTAEPIDHHLTMRAT
jgi:hypothetical protein